MKNPLESLNMTIVLGVVILVIMVLVINGIDAGPQMPVIGH